MRPSLSKLGSFLVIPHPDCNQKLIIPLYVRPKKKRTELRQKRLLYGMWESLLVVCWWVKHIVQPPPHCASSLFWVSECATTLTLGLGFVGAAR